MRSASSASLNRLAVFRDVLRGFDRRAPVGLAILCSAARRFATAHQENERIDDPCKVAVFSANRDIGDLTVQRPHVSAMNTRWAMHPAARVASPRFSRSS
jgi:hypothetical protein